MHQLFSELRSRSEEDAAHLLQRIRRGADPESVLQMIRDGDLLMQPWMASAAANNVSARSPLWSFAQREFDLHFWVLAPAHLGLGKRSSPPKVPHLLSSSEQWSVEGDKTTMQEAPPLFSEQMS